MALELIETLEQVIGGQAGFGGVDLCNYDSIKSFKEGRNSPLWRAMEPVLASKNQRQPVTHLTETIPHDLAFPQPLVSQYPVTG